MSDIETTDNKAIMQRFEDAMNTNDPEIMSQTIDQLVAPDVLFHAPVTTGQNGAPAVKRVMMMLHDAFPDIHVEIEDMIAEEDKVVARSTVTGTHRGTYMTVPPTGKSVKYNEIFVFRFALGRIAEIWGVVDTLAQLKQLGVMR